jgi:hypothetical protein
MRLLLLSVWEGDKAPPMTQVAKWPKYAQGEFSQAMAWLEENGKDPARGQGEGDPAAKPAEAAP